MQPFKIYNKDKCCRVPLAYHCVALAQLHPKLLPLFTWKQVRRRKS